MPHTMHRDPFGAVQYERVCHGPGECAWCGQKRPRVYTYVWVRDDRTAPRTSLDSHVEEKGQAN